MRNTLSTHYRFWSKVVRGKDGCWDWGGCVNPREYGIFVLSENPRKYIRTHRFAYIEVKGPIPEGLELDHLCRNTKCVNPAHLEAVTHRENMLRGFGWSGVNARKVVCAKGHPLTPLDDARRDCKVCAKLRNNINNQKPEYKAQRAIYNKAYYEIAENKERRNKLQRERRAQAHGGVS